MQGKIPLIDVSPLRTGDSTGFSQVAAQIRAACQDHGFFYIFGHGVDDALSAEAFDAAKEFFNLPVEQKMLVHKARSKANRGYEPLRAQTLQAGTPPDIKEGYYVGVEFSEDDSRVLAGKFGHGPNQWPATLPRFRPSMERYFDEMLALGKLLMQAVAHSLELPKPYFEEFLDGALATLRPLHYPPQPAQPQPGEKGCGEHTDFGSITLLAQDEVGGLQVLDAASGQWIDAPYIPGTLVVNIGDLLARWTNGRYHSTLHRVINKSGQERYSMPFFLGGHADFEIVCLPGCVQPGELPRFGPITVNEHYMERFRSSYGEAK